jgi:UDP-N-acetylglucosamine 1-carboxyvinyltransferase
VTERTTAERLVIRGGVPLRGAIRASGAKNAALPIMAASLLTTGVTVLRRVPRLADVDTMIAILRALGARVDWVEANALRIGPDRADGTTAPRELVRRMRASVCILGPLLATRGVAVLPAPGGCVIGRRPIDLHLGGLRALGATVVADEEEVSATAGRLCGARLRMTGRHGSTVLGTANVLMAATLARGTTVIEGAAREPEVQDLASFLVACGARIEGVGTGTLTVTGTETLMGTEHCLMPDRIEAGTFLAAAGITGGDVTVTGARPSDMAATLRAMARMGVEIEAGPGSVRARGCGPLRAVDLSTAPYPGLPTDMQPQLATLLAVARGTSTVAEGVYPDRFTHTTALGSMGAQIVRRGRLAAIKGVAGLRGAEVTATDLRAGAALVLAGLAAEGVTEISGLEQIDRGYQDLAARLRWLGANVERVLTERPPTRARIPA